MTELRQATRIPQNPDKPKRFVFVLLENFTLLCFSAAVECLRIANRMADEELTGAGGLRIATELRR